LLILEKFGGSRRSVFTLCTYGISAQAAENLGQVRWLSMDIVFGMNLQCHAMDLTILIFDKNNAKVELNMRLEPS
jgi:hypothetical protein